MKIGALLGDGSPDEVKILSKYGRTYGILLTLRDEFVDMFEQDELVNRIEKEILPLPIMVSLTEESIKTKLLQLLKGEINEDQIEGIIDIVIGSRETKSLIAYMKHLIDELVDTISPLRACRERLELLAKAVLEDL